MLPQHCRIGYCYPCVCRHTHRHTRIKPLTHTQTQGSIDPTYAHDDRNRKNFLSFLWPCWTALPELNVRIKAINTEWEKVLFNAKKEENKKNLLSKLRENLREFVELFSVRQSPMKYVANWDAVTVQLWDWRLSIHQNYSNVSTKIKLISLRGDFILAQTFARNFTRVDWLMERGHWSNASSQANIKSKASSTRSPQSNLTHPSPPFADHN